MLLSYAGVISVCANVSHNVAVDAAVLWHVAIIHNLLTSMFCYQASGVKQQVGHMRLDSGSHGVGHCRCSVLRAFRLDSCRAFWAVL